MIDAIKRQWCYVFHRRYWQLCSLPATSWRGSRVYELCSRCRRAWVQEKGRGRP